MMADVLIAPAEALQLMGGAPPKRPTLRSLGQVLPLLAFDVIASLIWVGVYATTGKLRLATGIGVAVGAAQIAWRLVRRQPVAALQWIGLGLVVVLGATAVVTHNPRFVMIKPSIIYTLIGVAMLQPGWMLRYTPPMPALPIPPSTFTAAGYAMAALMFVSAVLNAYFAIVTAPTTWALFVAVYPITSKLLAFGAAFAVLREIGVRNAKAGKFYLMETAR
jgi:intracellular septation protein